jgi:hypothetical protein
MNPSIPPRVVAPLKQIKLKIIEKYETQGNFCFNFGLSQPYVSEVLNGLKFLNNDERKLWAEALDLPESAFPFPIYKTKDRSKQIIGWSNKEDSKHE